MPADDPTGPPANLRSVYDRAAPLIDQCPFFQSVQSAVRTEPTPARRKILRRAACGCPSLRSRRAAPMQQISARTVRALAALQPAYGFDGVVNHGQAGRVELDVREAVEQLRLLLRADRADARAVARGRAGAAPAACS